MKNILLVVGIFLFLTIPKIGLAASGTVAYTHSSCDYFIVFTGGDYALLEWYGGYEPDLGDTLVGGYEDYGFKDIYDTTMSRDTKVWVEDYRLSKDRVIEKYQDHCRGRYPIIKNYPTTYSLPPTQVNTCATYGSNAVTAVNNQCLCASGYEWNSGMTECIKSLVCSDGSVKKNNQCFTYTEDCTQSFGKSIYGIKGLDGNSMCYCSEGYEWSLDGKSCVKKNVSEAPPVATNQKSTPPKTSIISAGVFRKDLGTGARGADVKKLENFLSKEKYLKTKPDDYFGTATRTALMALQKKLKFPVNGKLQGKTRDYINSLVKQ